MDSASWKVGVERLAGRVELLDAVALEHRDQLRVHERDALGEMALRLARRTERALEVVHHRQQLAHEPAAGALARGRRLARSALAVVLEVGLRAAGHVEVLVALAAGGRQGILVPGGLTVHALGGLLGRLHARCLVRRILLAGGLGSVVA